MKKNNKNTKGLLIALSILAATKGISASVYGNIINSENSNILNQREAIVSQTKNSKEFNEYIISKKIQPMYNKLIDGEISPTEYQDYINDIKFAEEAEMLLINNQDVEYMKTVEDYNSNNSQMSLVTLAAGLSFGELGLISIAYQHLRKKENIGSTPNNNYDINENLANNSEMEQ